MALTLPKVNGNLTAPSANWTGGQLNVPGFNSYEQTLIPQNMLPDPNSAIWKALTPTQQQQLLSMTGASGAPAQAPSGGAPGTPSPTPTIPTGGVGNTPTGSTGQNPVLGGTTGGLGGITGGSIGSGIPGLGGQGAGSAGSGGQQFIGQLMGMGFSQPQAMQLASMLGSGGPIATPGGGTSGGPIPGSAAPSGDQSMTQAPGSMFSGQALLRDALGAGSMVPGPMGSILSLINQYNNGAFPSAGEQAGKLSKMGNALSYLSPSADLAKLYNLAFTPGASSSNPAPDLSGLGGQGTGGPTSLGPFMGGPQGNTGQLSPLLANNVQGTSPGDVNSWFAQMGMPSLNFQTGPAGIGATQSQAPNWDFGQATLMGTGLGGFGTIPGGDGIAGLQLI